MRLAVLLFLCACWRGGGETEAVEPGLGGTDEPVGRARIKGAPCDEVADNAKRVLFDSPDPALRERARPLRDIVERHCNDDGWSVELRRCIGGARSIEDADGCEKLATPRQRDSLERELEALDLSEGGGP